MRQLFAIGLLVSIILSGCRVIPSTQDQSTIVEVPLPTPTILPTDIPVTQAVIPTPTPESTPTEEIVSTVPPEAIDIQYPLSGQSVSSTSMEIRGIADPAFEQNLGIRLIAFDGTELLVTSTTIQADMGQRGPFTSRLSYDAGSNTDGMLQVFSRSAKDGSLEHLASRIVKFGAGTPGPAAEQQPDERIALHAVRIGQANTRLQLQAEGSASGLFENTLAFKLCGDGGVGTADFICGGADNVIIASHTTTNASEMGALGSFTILAELPNGKWRNGRVVVYSISPANGEVDHAASLPIRNGP